MPNVVIIGGGFGGLYCAKNLANKNVDVTLIDKRNFHLFQPLLYQVATGGLSPGDISSPIRAIFNRAKNIKVLCGELENIKSNSKKVIVDGYEITYDTLVLATGVSHHYFGNDEWAKNACGLKTIEDALKIRMYIMRAFEKAEFEQNPQDREKWQKFVIIGGGPTGVELAGALGELANQTLKNDFRNIDPRNTKIFLIEGSPRILPTFPEDLSLKAQKSLTKLGVNVKTNSRVTQITKESVTIKIDDELYVINAKTIIWAAGVKASSVSNMLKESAEVELDKAGRVIVNQDLTIASDKDIFVLGDLAHFETKNGNFLPGVAPVAIQQGEYVAKAILKKIKGKSRKEFKYLNKGNLAVIGRSAAIADFGFYKLSGWPAWLLWLFVHIGYLIEYDNKLKVMLEWAWNFFTRKKGARLITKIDC